MTAVLFAAATQLGGHLAGIDAAGEKALFDYGMALGYAFQIADDVLDYAGDAATLGKNLGDDLAEGKATLPLIHAMAHSAPGVQQRLKQIVVDGDAAGFPEVLAAINDCGSLRYSRTTAQHYANQAITALNALPESEARQALAGLAHYALSRTY